MWLICLKWHKLTFCPVTAPDDSKMLTYRDVIHTWASHRKLRGHNNRWGQWYKEFVEYTYVFQVSLYKNLRIRKIVLTSAVIINWRRATRTTWSKALITHWRNSMRSTCVFSTEPIVPFHKDFSPSGEQLEHRSWVVTTQCRLYSNILQILLLYKTWRYNNKFDSTK